MWNYKSKERVVTAASEKYLKLAGKIIIIVWNILLLNESVWKIFKWKKKLTGFLDTIITFVFVWHLITKKVFLKFEINWLVLGFSTNEHFALWQKS